MTKQQGHCLGFIVDRHARLGVLACWTVALIQGSHADTLDTNSPSWLTTGDAKTLSWRSFDFHPRVSEGVMCDDNVLFSQHNPQSDAVNLVSPGLQIVGGDRESLRQYESEDHSFDFSHLNAGSLVTRSSEDWPGKFLVLDYAPRWQTYFRNSGEDALDHFLAFNAVWPVSKLVLGASQGYGKEKTVLVESLNRSSIETVHSEVDAAYRFNEYFSASTTFERMDVSYPDTTNLLGYVEWPINLTVNRQMNDDLHIGLLLGGGVDEISGNLGQQFERLGLTGGYQYSQRFSVDADVGVEDRQYDSGLSDTYSPFFGLGATYSPGVHISIRLGAFRRQSPSLTSQYSSIMTGGAVAVQNDISDRVTLQEDLSYYQVDYTPIANILNTSKSSDYYSARITGGYKAFKYLNVEIYYQFRGSGLSQNNNVVQDNQCGAQLVLRY